MIGFHYTTKHLIGPLFGAGCSYYSQHMVHVKGKMGLEAEESSSGFAPGIVRARKSKQQKEIADSRRICYPLPLGR